MLPMTNLNIILASGSPRRKQLLTSLGLQFQVIVSNVSETVESAMTPSDYVRTIARRKAEAVYHCVSDKPELNNGLIISADTTVTIDGKMLGKPRDAQDAFAMLSQLQGRTHEVLSAICLLKIDEFKCLIEHVTTSVTMKTLTPSEITAYCDTGEPLDKAGAYAIQGIGATLIHRIEGDYFNVVGMSLSLLSDMLAKLGHPLLVPTQI